MSTKTNFRQFGKLEVTYLFQAVLFLTGFFLPAYFVEASQDIAPTSLTEALALISEPKLQNEASVMLKNKQLDGVTMPTEGGDFDPKLEWYQFQGLDYLSVAFAAIVIIWAGISIVLLALLFCYVSGRKTTTTRQTGTANSNNNGKLLNPSQKTIPNPNNSIPKKPERARPSNNSIISKC